MKAQYFFALSLLVSASLSHGATVLFDFNNNTDFDGSAGVGTQMTRAENGEIVTLTTISILAPEIVEDAGGGTFSATGATVAAVTSIGTSNSLGINNPSINNSNYGIYSGAGGTEGNDMNPGESWVVSFNSTITIPEIDFASIDNIGEFFDVTIEGQIYSLGDGMSGDTFSDPFSGRVIPADTNITFTARGPLDTTNIRIAEITVDVVPEPSTTTLVGILGLLVGFRRKRR